MEEYTDELRCWTEVKSPHAETQRCRHRACAPDLQLRSDEAADGKPRPANVHYEWQDSQGRQKEESPLMVDTQYLYHTVTNVCNPVCYSHYEVRHQKWSLTSSPSSLGLVTQISVVPFKSDSYQIVMVSSKRGFSLSSDNHMDKILMKLPGHCSDNLSLDVHTSYLKSSFSQWGNCIFFRRVGNGLCTNNV